MDPEPLYIIILLIILTIFNSFLIASNTSISLSNKSKVKEMIEEGNAKANRLLKLLENETRVLAIMNIAIVIQAFFTSAIAVITLTTPFASIFKGMDKTLAYYLSAFIITIIVSFINLIFGVVIPRLSSSINPEKMAMKLMGYANFVVVLYTPFYVIIETFSKICLRLVGIKTIKNDEKASEDEIMELVEDGGISESEKEMIDSVFEFNDISCEEIMTPRKDVYMIDINEPLKNYVDEMLDESYSRIPVYDGDIDNIIGILYLKDFLLEARKVGFENVNIRKIIREPLFVPARKKINELFKELQVSKTHLAILIDEYGGFSGIVTNEDLVEEVMGDIDDEFDDEDTTIKKIGDFTYKIQGITTIKEINDELHIDLDEDSQDYDTLGGFIVYLLDRIPDDKETPEVVYKGIRFKVAKVTNRRIETVIMNLPKPTDIDENKKA